MKNIHSGFTLARKQTGFTLIELLIVMAILGILFAGLVVAINPAEQIKKANDSQMKTSTAEFRKAIFRYTTSRSAYPWDEVAEGGVDCLNGNNDPVGVLVADVDECNDALIAVGDVGVSIQDNAQLREGLYVTEDVTSSPNNLIVCYKPEAQQNINDPLTQFTSEGEATCTVGSGDCYWCAY